MEKTSFADWYPILRPLYFRAPTWISGFLNEAAELKHMETNLWYKLIGEAKDLLDQGKMRPSMPLLCKWERSQADSGKASQETFF